MLRVKLLWNYNVQGLALPQALGGVQFRGSCLVSSYWGIAICRAFLCIRLLGSYVLQSLVLRRPIGGLHLAGAIPVRHIVLKHAKSVVDRGWSYI